jgi:hypothetical protein
MRLYPASPTGLSRTFASDVAVILALCLFAWLGLKVHDGIAELAAVGRGIQDSGRAISSSARQTTSAVEGAFDDAANRVGGLPLVGGDLAGALREAPRGATRPLRETADVQAARLVALGREQERRTYQLATLVGWLTFGIPALLLLALTVPPRIRGIVRRTRAQRMFDRAPRDVLAARAAYNLPYGQLARYTRDPFTELAEGRHAALLAALADDAGVKLRG